jgi:hypothetical protein
MATSAKTPKTAGAESKTRRKEISGQFAKGKRHSDNNGVASADPRVFSGKERVTRLGRSMLTTPAWPRRNSRRSAAQLMPRLTEKAVDASRCAAEGKTGLQGLGYRSGRSA